MSLFGALTSGVSGLIAQSSAMSAVADNITNVSTVGYKNVDVDFQTLVTKQTSVTFFSAGGVQSRPKQANDVQGLLQASTSQTDIGVSGSGFFVVNESNRPTINNQFLFTRAGSFFQDDEGFLRNTAGFYLQAWPTDAAGNIILPPNSNAGLTNQNIISTDFLSTVNLARVGGSAAETQTIAIGANLPANASAGATQRTDVQFFDTLGNTNDVSFVYTKSTTPNQWDLTIEPPSGTQVLTVFDSSGGVQNSVGQLEFLTIPDLGQSVIIGGVTYTFQNGGGTTNDNIIDRTGTLAQLVADLVVEVNNDLGAAGTASAKAGNLNTLLITGGNADVVIDPNNVTTGGVAATRQSIDANQDGDDDTFTVQNIDNTANAIIFNSDGLPLQFNVAEFNVLGFASGAANMNDVDLNGDGIVDVARVQLDFGSIGQADGMTQFGAEFTPTFIQQDGARFGVFAGVTIDTDGLMTALFDNGELRTIFKIPVATFTNANGLEHRTGNVWNATQRSGDPTLRVADNGPAGQIIQASLEASTVDIGEEFTNMIIIQRAFTAATRIISTADQMLDELVRVKR